MIIKPLSEQWHEAALEWVDAEAAASLLEDTKASVLSQKMLELGDIPVSRAEMHVKGTDDWKDYLTKIHKARTHANRLKVRCDYLRMKFSEFISQDANERQKERLG